MDEFVQLEEEWAEIVATRDVARAEGFLADDFVLASAGGLAPRMPRQAWIDALPQIETRSLRCSDVEARVFDTVAVVHLRLRWDAVAGGRDLSGEYAVTDVFTGGGRWRPSWRLSVRLPAS